MSLDTTEPMLDIEDAFKIHYPERIDKPVKTVGELHEFIICEMSKREVPDSDAVWNKLVDLISRFVKMPESRIHRETRFVEDLGMG